VRTFVVVIAFVVASATALLSGRAPPWWLL
jgi:hypothetical protein